MKRSTIELTNLEKIVKKGLDELNIEYIEQYPTRTGFVLDFFIFKGNIDLEVDGVYHDNSKARKRDNFRSYMLRGEGYKIVRIHHNEIKESNIKEVLRRKLGGIQ